LISIPCHNQKGEQEMTEENKVNENVTGTPVDKRDERMWAMFCHLSGLAGYVFPFGNIIAPLVIWILKKEEFPLVNDQGKEAINFQISMTIYIIAAIILIFLIIGIPLLIILGLFDLLMIIIASIKANEGVEYRYPLTIRFLD
jgi:uncharacterized Tic20 family protein